jgi:dolichol-phosphate mannosyltransferase
LSVTVLIPTYNEAENLPRLVPALLGLPLPDLEILFIDDNSPDGTGQLADELAGAHPGRIRVHHRPAKLGLGSAYVLGYRLALEGGAEAVAHMDADFSHPPEKLPELVGKMEAGYDIVFGSRYIEGGSVDLNWPLWRKGLSRWGNFYARTILGLSLRDVTGAFRVWRRDVLAAMPFDRIVSNGYAFQVEVVYLAHKLGFRFGEVPFYFADRKWGKSKMSLRIQLEAAIRTWQLPFHYRDLRPAQQRR